MQKMSKAAKRVVTRICSSSEPYQPGVRPRDSGLKQARALNEEELPEPKTIEELQERLREDLGFKLEKDIEEKGLTKQEMKEIVELMSHHRAALALSYNDLAEVKRIKMKIDLIEGAEPVAVKPRPTPPHLREVERLQIERWKQQGVIEDSIGSPWNSPLVIVPKKMARGVCAATFAASTP